MGTTDHSREHLWYPPPPKTESSCFQLQPGSQTRNTKGNTQILVEQLEQQTHQDGTP